MYNTNHEFTNNEREISIPHGAVECGIENFTPAFYSPLQHRCNTVKTLLRLCYNTFTTSLKHRYNSPLQHQ